MECRAARKAQPYEEKLEVESLEFPPAIFDMYMLNRTQVGHGPGWPLEGDF